MPKLELHFIGIWALFDTGEEKKKLILTPFEPDIEVVTSKAVDVIDHILLVKITQAPMQWFISFKVKHKITYNLPNEPNFIRKLSFTLWLTAFDKLRKLTRHILKFPRAVICRAVFSVQSRSAAFQRLEPWTVSKSVKSQNISKRLRRRLRSVPLCSV